MSNVTITFIALITCVISLSAQVKPEYLYNTSTPFGTLDIRTSISASDKYLLKEGETFSYRETSPGVRSTTYRDMTDWDSSPFEQGHMVHRKGTAEQFVMNYRILKPINYDENFEEGYPMIVMMHGGYERANCHFNDCYHADWNYDPLENAPAAPSGIEHELLNNDHNVNLGGRQHIDARNWAGSRLPDAPDLSERAFPGFVLIPQMMNTWDSLSVENVIRIALLHTQNYKINLNRIYIHGLSMGGHGVYQVIKRAPWMFAAALPMSAVESGYIFKHAQQSKLINIPLWIFQGAEDTRPSVATTAELIDKFREAGATIRYTEYPDIGHAVWNRAYGEDDFFQFMLSQDKSFIYPVGGLTTIVKKEDLFPTLMLPEGFFAYQWEKDGQLLEEASNILNVDEPGSYRARFSRVNNPGESNWNRWSQTVLITEEEELVTAVENPAETLSLYPNPSSSDNLFLKIDKNAAAEVIILDMMGRTVYEELSIADNSEFRKLKTGNTLTNGMYLVLIRKNDVYQKRRLIIRN